jgi:polyferredoxin
VALFVRSEIDLTVRAERNPLFDQMSDGSVRNTYELRLRNMTGDDRPFRITVTGAPMLYLQIEGTPYETVQVEADEMLIQRVYVTAPAGSEAAQDTRTDFRIWVQDLESNERTHEDTHFNGLESR